MADAPKLADLQEMLDTCARALEDQEVESLDRQGENGQTVSADLIRETVAAMDALALKLGTVCQQGVLAIRIKR